MQISRELHGVWIVPLTELRDIFFIDMQYFTVSLYCSCDVCKSRDRVSSHSTDR